MKIIKPSFIELFFLLLLFTIIQNRGSDETINIFIHGGGNFLKFFFKTHKLIQYLTNKKNDLLPFSIEKKRFYQEKKTYIKNGVIKSNLELIDGKKGIFTDYLLYKENFTDNFFRFYWNAHESGLYSDFCREEAGIALYFLINDYITKNNIDITKLKLNFVCQSHGGNVALQFVKKIYQEQSKLRVNLLVLLEPPIGSESEEVILLKNGYTDYIIQSIFNIGSKISIGFPHQRIDFLYSFPTTFRHFLGKRPNLFYIKLEEQINNSLVKHFGHDDYADYFWNWKKDQINEPLSLIETIQSKINNQGNEEYTVNFSVNIIDYKNSKKRIFAINSVLSDPKKHSEFQAFCYILQKKTSIMILPIALLTTVLSIFFMFRNKKIISNAKNFLVTKWNNFKKRLIKKVN